MMYRLLNVKSLSQKNFKIITAPKSTDLYNKNNIKLTTTFTTLFNSLKFYNFSRFNVDRITGASRNISSTIKPGLSSCYKQKKKQKRIKKFTELLQVKNGSFKQTKTPIQELKSKKLTAFINKRESGTKKPSTLAAAKAAAGPPPPTTLNKNMFEVDDQEKPLIFLKNNIGLNLEKGSEQLRSIIDSYKMFREMHELTEHTEYTLEEPVTLISSNVLDTPYLEDEHDVLHEEEHLEVIAKKKTKNKETVTTKKTRKQKVKEIYKSKHHKSAEQEILAKQQTLITSLISYIDVCVNRGLINRAFSALQHYRYRQKLLKYSHLVNNIDLYNMIISGYAEKGYLNKIKEVLTFMSEDQIQLVPQTYAYIIECLGRYEGNAQNIELLNYYKNEAINLNISLNDILDKSKFTNDRREIVLSAIKRIEPNFTPIYTPPQLTYSNELLNNLNTNILPIALNTNQLANDDAFPGCEIMNSKSGFKIEELDKFAQTQFQVELDGYITIPSVNKSIDLDDNTNLIYKEKVKELNILWRAQICAAFNRDLNSLRAQTKSKSNRTINLLPYLKALDVEQYANILLKELRILAEGSDIFSPTVGQLYKGLGLKVQTRYHLEQKKRNGVLDKISKIYGLYCETLSKCNSSDNPRQCWQRITHHTRENGVSMDVLERMWPISIQIGVGRFLYQILMNDLKIDVNIMRPTMTTTTSQNNNNINNKSQKLLPAFYTIFRNHGKLIKEEIKPHPVLSRLYKVSQQKTLTFDANLVPMLSPPQPWTTPYTGGYLLTHCELLRLPYQAYQQLDRINKIPVSDMYAAFDSLNQLGSIPWKVNTTVLDIILNIFTNGGSKKLNVPKPPSSLSPVEIPENYEKLTKKEKFIIHRDKSILKRTQAEMYSLWCEALYRLSLANYYRDKTFWLPHNMDFRGRVYPIPPHLSHLGSDLARSLLIFNQAKPLGTDGFQWLKLHCINLTGLKKRDSIQDRLTYADTIMDDIIDSADHPLNGRMWWSKSDEPWQTLACCIEIANVLRSNNPENYLSNFPIHQDGSCNGLQHYAALGRDVAGAKSVNLAPTQIPQDVYSSIAALVEESRVKDDVADVKIAKILNGFIRRKVIKQTVMTTVYGVTRFGARLQIAKQLKDINEFPQEYVWSASSYLTMKTFESLREMFTSTREIQDWFTDCARLISTVCSENVEWITPLGLPVVQPYNNRSDKKSIKLNTIYENFPIDQYEKPNVLKQKNAFPPNFIHSLDSSHMMLTGLNCEKNGLTFISVHDCFWTHACTVPEMNRMCREQFVALHSQPILENLSKFLAEKYSYSDKDFTTDGTISDFMKYRLNKMLLKTPARGDFDLNNILSSVYFFS